MSEVREGNVVWTFADGWLCARYDEWSFYRRRFNGCIDGPKAIDIIAIDPEENTAWLIEAKDYRHARRARDRGWLWDEVARKVHDSLAGLLAAASNAVDDERRIARRFVRAGRIRIVLHLEQPTTPSKLFPRAFDPADVSQRLRRLVRAIDPHPVVMSSTTDWGRWTTAWDPP